MRLSPPCHLLTGDIFSFERRAGFSATSSSILSLLMTRRADTAPYSFISLYFELMMRYDYDRVSRSYDAFAADGLCGHIERARLRKLRIISAASRQGFFLCVPRRQSPIHAVLGRRRCNVASAFYFHCWEKCLPREFWPTSPPLYFSTPPRRCLLMRHAL